MIGLIFLIVLASLLANPAPLAIEFSDLVLIALPCLAALFSLGSNKTFKLYPSDNKLLLAIILYLSYLLLSALMGLIHGVPMLTVLRSVGPYLNFFPLILISLLAAKTLRPSQLGLILILVGLMQVAYLFYLYFTHSSQIHSTWGVLVNRVTLRDQRTTLPLLLAVTSLPFIYLKSARKWITYFMALTLILLGFFAGIATLTRAIFLSILFGWLVFLLLYLYQKSRINSVSVLSLLGKLLVYLPLIALILALISCIPKIHLIEMGLLSRFNHYPAQGGADYSNGRLYDEWIPALMTWLNSDLLGLFFGIGAGNAFTVLSGEERTYIHNLTIYTLVYGGFYGFLSCLWLYFMTFKTLVRQALQTEDLVYLAFASLLASMYFYGQLFAVHKGLAFNVMLFLIIGLALRQPESSDDHGE